MDGLHFSVIVRYSYATIIIILGEGSNLDYTLGHPFIRAFFESSTSDEVVATFRIDSVALEPDETFSLELVPLSGITLPSGCGVFFINIINVTIIDHDSKFVYKSCARTSVWVWGCLSLLKLE